MSAVFLKLLNLSITAGWLILAVVLVRFLLKKAPKRISCILWSLAAVRLVCPFSIESALSLVPSGETVNTTHYAARPYIQSGVDMIDNAANGYLGSRYFEGVTVAPRDSLSNPINIIAVIWLIGMAAMLLYALISYIRLKRSVRASIHVTDNILACDDVRSPFILGIVKPVIYVPSSMEKETFEYVITHETAHIKRRDHWWKPLGFLLLAVYWFNPLCWLAYILFCRDIEMACDEKVIRNMEKGSIAEYSQALLDCSFPRRGIAACPLAFGEVGVKKRVKSVLNYKKPAFWVITAAIIACIVLAVCFLTDPVSDRSLSDTSSVSHTGGVDEATPDSVTACAWANWTEESGIYAGCLNADMMAISSVCHLPIFRVDSEDEIARFKSRFEGELTFSEGLDEMPSFDDAVKEFDGGFFKNYTLFIVYVPSSSGTYRYDVSDIYNDGDAFCVHVRQTNSPEVVNAMMAGWFMLVGVPSTDVAGCTVFDADLDNTMN